MAARSQPPDTFVGRRQELARLGRLLRGRRLVTLVGPAGMGKSRLATELAARIGHRYPDGARIADAGAIPADVGTRPALLVLDNCERRIPGCEPLVHDLLGRAPNLTVLATSREPLEVPGEVTFPVGGLGKDAVALFADRAGRVIDDPAAVAEICVELDGMPLAVEAAARRFRFLTAGQLLARLPERLDLLDGLRDAVSSSYSRLSTVEQSMFRELSVFESGFDVDAAATVCALGDLTAALDLVARLETRSMVVADAPGRFRLLRSFRAFAREQLGPAADDVHRRLVSWACGLAAPAVEELSDAGETLCRWRTEAGNLRLACGLARENERTLPAVALARCHRLDGRPAEAQMLLNAVLGLAGTPPAHHAIALVEAGWLACGRLDYDEALRLGEGAVSHLRPLGELAPLGQALRLLGFIQLSRGEFAAAREHIEEWVTIARRLNRPLAAAWGMHGRAWVDLRAGDLDQAAATLSEVSLLAQALGARTLGTATTITTSGIALARDDHETAQLLFVELLRSKPDDAWARTYALEGLVLTAAARGQHECVLLLAGAAQAILGSTRVATEPEWSDQVGRAVAAARTEAGPRAGGLLAEGARLTLDEAIDCAVHGWTHPPSAGRLGKRELQVARLVAKGLTNDQIAGELHISRRTVATHLEHVREKLGLRSRIDIAIWSTEHDRDLP